MSRSSALPHASRLAAFAAAFGLALASPSRGAEPQGTRDTLRLEDHRVKARKRPALPKSGFEEMRKRSSPVLDWKKKVRLKDPNVAAQFVGEVMVPGGYTWMYPAGSGYPVPSMTDKQAHDSRFSLEVHLKHDAWSGGAVCSPTPFDLAPYLETAVLEIWARGAEGKEVFGIALLDNGNNGAGRPLQVTVNSRSFTKVLNSEWKKIQVPLRAFGSRGSYWSEELNARVSNAFNWSQVNCLSFDIDKERFKSFRVYIDDAVIFKKAPGGAAAGGAGYTFSNEDFQDFPAATDR
jgi:hypothetical protein